MLGLDDTFWPVLGTLVYLTCLAFQPAVVGPIDGIIESVFAHETYSMRLPQTMENTCCVC